MLKNRYPHLKVTLAIGGWNEGSTNYSQMASDPTRRTEFVGNALEFIKYMYIIFLIKISSNKFDLQKIPL